jgi:glycosyltransferase involved in cell wall biosynthesis
MNTDTPMVSIRCITYNHEPYIRQCLEGFVMQKTNFKFEAIVHDDASTDHTADIIREYAAKYPDIIKPIYETENQYSKHDGSLRRIMDAACTGKYIALCEGDDYWIDPLKLQKQVDFLEANSEYSMCFHKADTIFWPSGELSPLYQDLKEKDYTIDEIAENWIVPTCSVVYRSIFQNKIPKNKKFIHGDIVLFLTMATHGKVHCLNDKMSIYRRLSTGATLKIKNLSRKERVLHNLKASESWKETGKHFAVSERIIRKFVKNFQCSYLCSELHDWHFKSVFFDNTSISFWEKIKLSPLLLKSIFKYIFHH